MKFATLLAQRENLVRRARLANLAFAHAKLAGFARRLARAGLRGRFVLRSADPFADRFGATLTAIDAHQSVVDEHFSDEEIAELADVFGFLTQSLAVDLAVDAGTLETEFLAPVRAELARAGVQLPHAAGGVEEQSSRSPAEEA